MPIIVLSLHHGAWGSGSGKGALRGAFGELFPPLSAAAGSRRSRCMVLTNATLCLLRKGAHLTR